MSGARKQADVATKRQRSTLSHSLTYLALNPDVLGLVAQGDFESAESHYEIAGRMERRQTLIDDAWIVDEVDLELLAASMPSSSPLRVMALSSHEPVQFGQVLEALASTLRSIYPSVGIK